jgi:hypothetical protein
MTTEVWTLVFGTLQGVIVASVVVLALFIGFCVLFGLAKLRPSGRATRVIRSLDEAVGPPERYLKPGDPRGPVDQLRTPELLEAAARKSG